MLYLAIVALFVVANSQTCKSSTGGQTVTQSLTVEGVKRDYQLFVPDGVAYPSSLVLAWHGISASPAEIEKAMLLLPQANSRKFIVVYPEAKNKGGGLFNPPAFNGAACCKNDASFKDVEFAVAIKHALVDAGCVDGNRVYSMGYSNGGFMTHRLACETNGVLRAAAIVSGTHGDYGGNLANSPWNNCPGSTLPVIGFMGDSDIVVPFRGGNNPSPLGSSRWFSFYETIDVWAARNGCGAASSSEYTEGGQQVNRTTWSGCDVESHVLYGFGHNWWAPSTSKILEFFQGHGLTANHTTEKA